MTVPRSGWRLAACLLLAAATILVFVPTLGHGFVNYDDGGYVYENPHVRGGFGGGGLAWSIASTDELNWHPLTWMSLMLDADLHGLAADAPPFARSAPGFHATNVLLHAASTVLLFLLLARLTGADGRSAFVAGLFGLHPLHVESVAWISERKDVLSTLFGILATMAYVAYARRRAPARYVLAAVLLAAGLAAKPMLVTLPLILLLLDVGPLGRRAEGARRLLLEKVPLFALAAASSAITLYAQSRGGAVRSFESLPFAARLANASVAAATYLLKMVWPTGLAVFYPHPGGGLAASTVALSSIVLAVPTWVAVRNVERRPYFAFGWAWYLVTLLPVIGLVQVGGQAMADRYTYVPLIGPFVAVAWGAHDLLSSVLGVRRGALLAAGAATLVLLGALARVQVAVWKDSETLFRHALACTTDNPIAHNNLGLALLDGGKSGEAVPHFVEALRIRPAFVDAHVNLGRAFLEQRRLDEAERQLREAIRIDPGSAEARTNLGIALALGGRLEEAIGELRKAVELEPARAEWRQNLERAENLRRAQK